jgi:hypothetical protein
MAKNATPEWKKPIVGDDCKGRPSTTPQSMSGPDVVPLGALARFGCVGASGIEQTDELPAWGQSSIGSTSAKHLGSLLSR